MGLRLNLPKFADADVIASKMSNAEELRVTSDYEEVKDEYIELTMSCDEEEAMYQLKSFMETAIWQGLRGGEVKNNRLRIEFLAAYDLYKHIEEGR